MYIVVEGDDPGFDIYVNGQALARYQDSLEQLSLSLQLRPLLDFFSVDQNSMAQVMGPDPSEWGTMLPRPQWFFPMEGLETIHGLLEFLRQNPAAIGSETPMVVFELEEFERVLAKTAQYGLRWHLAVSFR